MVHIGIFTISLKKIGLEIDEEAGVSKAYFDWLYSCGADKVTILPHTCTMLTLRKRMLRIDGLVIPGGGDDIHMLSEPYFKHISRALEIAQKRNLPVFGICAGMMAMISFQLKTWPLHVHVYNVLNNTGTQTWHRKEIQNTPFASLIQLGQAQVQFNHHYGVPSVILRTADPEIRVLSTAEKGYASTITWTHLPWVATQWHPEKPQWEMSTYQNIVRSNDAKKMGQSIGEIFIELAKKTQTKPIDIDASPKYRKISISKKDLVKFDMPAVIYVAVASTST